MRIVIDKDVIVYEEDNEIILINMIKNTFHGLDTTGTIIWKKIEQSRNFSEIVDLVSKEFDITKEVINQDTKVFIYELEKIGVLKIYE